jgi:hypothetical protein
MVWLDRMIPALGCVVAHNETRPAAGFFDLSDEPIILTIPPRDSRYPVLAVDTYRTTVSNVNVHGTGTYTLIGAGWPRDLLPSITLIHVLHIFSAWMFRTGKFSDRTGKTAEAEHACQYRTRR